MEKKLPATIDEYIAGFPRAAGEMMETIRKAVHEAVPEVKEKISWGMATFYTRRTIVQFGGFKNHIGFFAGPETIEHFAKELSAFKTSKAGIHFPYSQPVPVELIKTITKYRKDNL